MIQCTADIVSMFVVATFPGTKYFIYYIIIFRSDIVANGTWWQERGSRYTRLALYSQRCLASTTFNSENGSFGYLFSLILTNPNTQQVLLVKKKIV